MGRDRTTDCESGVEECLEWMGRGEGEQDKEWEVVVAYAKSLQNYCRFEEEAKLER